MTRFECGSDEAVQVGALLGGDLVVERLAGERMCKAQLAEGQQADESVGQGNREGGGDRGRRNVQRRRDELVVELLPDHGGDAQNLAALIGQRRQPGLHGTPHAVGNADPLAKEARVAEAIVGRHAGMEIFGLSCISNLAAGLLPQPLSEAEVLEVTARASGSISDVLEGVIDRL